MNVLKMALRNIFRNKRRTTLTILAIVLGSSAIIIFGGYAQYSYWGIRESTIRSMTGHVQVYKKGYIAKGGSDPLSYQIDNFEEIKAKLKTLPYVKEVTAQLEFSGLVATDEKTAICAGVGVQPKGEKSMASFVTIIEGADVNENDYEGGVIGVGLHTGLECEIGDYLTIVTSTRAGGINAIDFKVRGVMQSGYKNYDDITIKLPLELVQRLMNAQSVTKVLILLDDTEHTHAFAKSLEKMIDDTDFDLEYRLWEDLAPNYWAVVRILDNIFYFLNVVIACIVIFSIANTLMMSVMERTTEIGTIRAIGTTQRGVLHLFLAEGVLIGLIGGILGIVCGIVCAWIINLKGIHVPPPPGSNRAYTNYILIVPGILLYSFCLAVFTSFVSSILPAIKASKMKIVDAIRYV